MQIGKSILALRKAANMTQGQVADQIGTTQAYLSKIEQNQKVPSFDIIQKLGDFYGVPVAFVLWGAVEEKDVSPEKREIFKQIKPLVDSLISQLN